nr:DUF4422 domain-containing protein [uncultured Acetatifactor sp.]
MGNFFYWDDATREIVNEMRLIIYGAGMMGNALYRCLSEAPYNKDIIGFIVNQKDGNPSNINYIPVMDLEEGKVYKDCLILVALHEKNIGPALEELEKEGFTNLLPITFDSDAWAHIRGNWIRSMHKDPRVIYQDQVVEKECRIYVAHSDRDKQLKEVLPLRSFEQPIQVGAALAQKRIFKICDDMGDNISEKNRKYCELTALYWMWKHDTSRYVGLCHYRRRFGIDAGQIDRLMGAGADFIVTTPIVNFLGVKKQYALDHDLFDWETVEEIISLKCPEYESAMFKVGNGTFYYGYNMFITRKEELDRYCKWLFPILEECEKRIGKKQDPYQDRYIGFLAERLLTVYIEKDPDLKVAVAEKHYLEK